MSSKMKCFLQPLTLPKPASAALLILRLIAGAAFVLHGWGKIQNPFEWAGPGGFPAPLQFLAAVSEFGGGIAWILGFLTRLGSLGIFCTMAVATHMHMVIRGDPFVGSPGYELASIYAAIAILFFVLGPGRFSLDSLIFKHRS